MRVHIHERGSVLVHVVIALAVLFGLTALTTDYGMMTVRQRKLQGATDAAALAAGPEMHSRYSAAAIQEAARYAGSNGANNLSFEWSGPFQLKVTAFSDVPTPFMRILDPGHGTRRVSAASEIRAFAAVDITETAKVRPWGIPVAFFDPEGGGPITYNETVSLLLVPNVDEQPVGASDGSYFVQPFALDINRKDPPAGPFSNYAHDVKFGFGKPISVSQSKQQETWMVSQPAYEQHWEDFLQATWQSVAGDPDSLINRSANNDTYRNDTWAQYHSENPRLVFLPIYDRVNRGLGNGNGDPKAQILGFTAFYVEGMDNPSNGQIVRITGHFVRHELPYDGRTLNPSTVREPITGILQFQLVK